VKPFAWLPKLTRSHHGSRLALLMSVHSWYLWLLLNLDSRFHLGVSGMYQFEHTASCSTTRLAIDSGVTAGLTGLVRFGVALQNAGRSGREGNIPPRNVGNSFGVLRTGGTRL
jgi:hypothetical protein